jgi:hypothetical protein
MAASNDESDAPVTTSAPPPPPRAHAPARKPPPSTPPSARSKDEGKGRGIAGKIFGFVLGTSSTTVRLDMQRPAFTRDRARQTNHNGWGDGPADVRGDTSSDGPVRHNFNVEQTRLKVTQKWEAGAFTRLGEGGVKKSRVDLGVGLDASLMEAEVLPECRVRVRLGNEKYSPNIYLHALPRQEIVARGRVPLLNTDLSLDVRVEVPLRWVRGDADRAPRISAQLTRPPGFGLSLNTSGLEFDERVLRIGDDAAVRVAATVDFPREFPVTDESPLRVRVRKLGASSSRRSPYDPVRDVHVDP